MLPIDWRAPTAYVSIQNLDTVGFAWEFLRRNPDYHHDHHEITHTASMDIDIVEERASRWGLCLPCRSYDRGT